MKHIKKIIAASTLLLLISMIVPSLPHNINLNNGGIVTIQNDLPEKD
jgi:hypothetical protein